MLQITKSDKNLTSFSIKYVFSIDLKVDWLRISNASLVEDEIGDHSTGIWTKRQYLYEFVLYYILYEFLFCLMFFSSSSFLTWIF